ncbi:MAG: hypothetical protein JWQ09_726 [Segetibacter sp.]|nr:hypothetical protein [Segetibacter sp.]
MKTGTTDNKRAKPGIDKDLKKYIGKNISSKKTAAFIQNIEQIKDALSKHSIAGELK